MLPAFHGSPPLPEPTVPSKSGVDLRNFFVFGGVGAFGGFCAFLFSRLLMVGPFAKVSLPLDLAGEVALGALAALFGVFLLTASDLTAPKTVIFALACGFFWNPILTSTQAYVTQHTDNTNTALASSSAKSTQNLGTQTEAQAQQTIQTATTNTNAAIANFSKVSPSAQQQIVAASTETVKNLTAPATATPQNVNAVVSIAAASQQQGAAAVHASALRQLEVLANSATNAQTKLQARQAYAKLMAVPR